MEEDVIGGFDDIDDLADKLLEEEQMLNSVTPNSNVIVEKDNKLNNVEAQADAIVNKENKHDRQVRFNKEFQEILEFLSKNGVDLREVQIQLQKRLSKYLDREVQIPYEVTEENIEDPQSLGDLDTLEEMSKYYNESFETTFDASKNEKRFGDRHANKKLSQLYLRAYDLASAMFAGVSAFYGKYKDLLEVETAEAPEIIDVIPEQPKPLIENPENELPTPVEVPLLPEETQPVEQEEKPAEQPKKKSPAKKTTPSETGKPSLLDSIDETYYKSIFKIINTTVVIGNKYKFNTLDYLEYELQNADISKMKEMGLPVNDPEKSELIKKICLRLIKESKEIRKDQWLPSSSDKKQGEFEGRKHSTQEAIVDRNTRLMEKFGIDLDTAKEYGLATSTKELNRTKPVKKQERTLVTSAKDDPKFVEFYENFKTVYKLGSPTSESSEFLYAIHKDLQNETNSFGLTGESLKAAKVLVEKTIIARRNSWQNGKEESKKSIEEIQKDLGL